jgi:hypothetical protein
LPQLVLPLPCKEVDMCNAPPPKLVERRRVEARSMQHQQPGRA